MAHCLTTPRLFPLVATIAHAQTPAACHPWLTLCVPERVCSFTCQFNVVIYDTFTDGYSTFTHDATANRL